MPRLPDKDRPAQATVPPRRTGRTKVLAISLAAHLVVLAGLALLLRSLPSAPPSEQASVIPVDLVAHAPSGSSSAVPADRPQTSELAPVVPDAPPPRPTPEPKPVPEPAPALVREPVPTPPVAAPPQPAPVIQDVAPQQPSASASTGQGTAREATGADSATAATRRAAQASYRDILSARLERAKIYPRTAMRRRIEGIVVVKMVLAANGSLRSVQIFDTSGYAVLDDAALALVRRVAPFPPPPASLIQGDGDVSFTARISYQLN